jgi:hypothetical protein
VTQDLPLDEVPAPDQAPPPEDPLLLPLPAEVPARDRAPPDQVPLLRPSTGEAPSDTRGPRPAEGPRPTGKSPRAGDAPLYKGEPLDPARGPGLGCFWFQVVLLGILLVLTPLSVVWASPPWVSAGLLIITLVLLLFAGQTVIFLLRLVAADRSTRRRPMGTTARKTVGMMEDESDADRASDAGDESGHSGT